MDVDMACPTDAVPSIESLDMIIITYQGNTIKISDDIKSLNKRTQYDQFIVNIKGDKVNTQMDVTELVHENGVIYIPEQIQYLFCGETFVKVSLIDPKTVDDISMIHIKPINRLFYFEMTQEKILQLLKNVKIMCVGHIVPEAFEIVGLFSESGSRLEFGTTCNTNPLVNIVEMVVHRMRAPEQPSLVKAKCDMTDFSKVKTPIYKKMFIMKGEVVYVK